MIKPNRNPQEVLILIGLPASGKSTRAEAWLKTAPDKRSRINYDELRIKLYGEGWTFNRAEEDAMQALAMEHFEAALKLGLSVVVDNTNLTKGSRQKWLDKALSYNIAADVEEIDTDVWTCIDRDRKREGAKRIGRAVIDRMALTTGWLDFSDHTKYPYDNFVICDLDGTLADITERRRFMAPAGGYCKPCGVAYELLKPIDDICTLCQRPLIKPSKDWKSFFADVSGDKLNGDVADLLEMFADDPYGIIIVSGRPIDQCGIATEDWLAKHGIRYDHLFMRQGGDHRQDTVIKREILDLLPKARIQFALDDRDSVVKMWRDNGITTLQVADGNFQ